MKPRHEMERTCKRDGTVWYVSMQQSKERAPGRLERVGAGMMSTGTRMQFGLGGRTAASTQQLQIEMKADRVRKANSCPACGSQSYIEKKVRIK